MEDETVLHLTDNMEGGDAAKESCAEFKAHMINVKEGHSLKIMEKCPLLYEYSYFVALVRRHIMGRDALLEAIDMAVKECIREGILADILYAHRAEATEMLLKEYDEELYPVTVHGVKTMARRGISYITGNSFSLACLGRNLGDGGYLFE